MARVASGRGSYAAVDILVRLSYIGAMTDETPKKKLTYADAGVDIVAGDVAVERIKKLAKATFNAQVLSEIGAFGGFFKPDFGGIESPVLLTSADGVGTKLKLAFMTGRHDTVGEDLVNHCVDDILVHGARALFFLDYIAVGHLEPQVVADVVEGLSRGCRNAGAALIGGETAELPDFYQKGEYDLAGFIVGVVDEKKIVNGSSIKPGMACLGLASSGLHTNGFSLARKVAFEIGGYGPEDRVEELGGTVAEALMAVHKSYGPLVHQLLAKYRIHGMAHITGGGLPGNLNRVLPKDCDAVVKKGSWPVLPVFTWLAKTGDLDREDVYRAFNMGIGFVLVVEAEDAEGMMGEIARLGEKVYRIGEIGEGEGKVRLVE